MVQNIPTRLGRREPNQKFVFRLSMPSISYFCHTTFALCRAALGNVKESTCHYHHNANTRSPKTCRRRPFAHAVRAVGLNSQCRRWKKIPSAIGCVFQDPGSHSPPATFGPTRGMDAKEQERLADADLILINLAHKIQRRHNTCTIGQ